ncbi:hypothetical protein ACPYOC_14945 [Ornithinimicrobium sp. W1665]|uniref:hypothetical protein n=1 Tax=Ornithinimicrobium sp. W1665 TaxID=3416666 RepID=UPI003CE8832F
MNRRFLAGAALVVSLSACGTDDTPEPAEPATTSDDAPTASPEAAAVTTAAASTSAPAELGTLKEAGFGQSDEYVWVTALVHNNSAYVGQTVTVNFNVLDAEGNILASESQVESFSLPETDHIVGTQVSLAQGETAAKVEAALDVEASGAFSDKPFPEMPTSPVKFTEEYGSHTASFELSNTLDMSLKTPRVSLLCRDDAGSIVGGGSAYPELVPAQGKVKVDVNLLASEEPADCSTFVGAPSDWDGAETAEQPTSEAAPQSGTPEEAFQIWVEQFGTKDWQAHYETLVSAQREVISEDAYVACRSAESPPVIEWGKTLSVEDVGEMLIPGTDVSLPATKVSAEVSAEGMTLPVDAHMLLEGGEWKWSMTQENVDNCSS